MSTFRNVGFALMTVAALVGSLDTAHAQNNTLMVSTTAITINAQVGSAPQPASPIAISTSGAALQFSFAPNTSWLVVSPTVGSGSSNLPTPNSLIIAANPSGLAQGQYFGTVTLTAAGATNSPVAINVTFNVTGSTQLTASPNSLNFAMQTGGAAPPAQQVTIGSSGSALNFTASVTTASGGNWLSISPVAGTTGTSTGVLTVNILPTGLTPNTYTGTITVTPAAGTGVSPITVNVVLTVSANPSLNLATTALTFYYQTGTSLPAAQTVAVASSGNPLSFGVSATTENGGSWLVVSPSGTLTTPQTLTVAIAASAASLAAGTYKGTISISAANASNPAQAISVTFVVSTSPLLTTNGSLAAFAYQTGAANPANQTLTLSSTSTAVDYAVNIAFTAGQNWLTVGPAAGNVSAAAPLTLTFSVNPAGLAAGDYTATVTISSTIATNKITFPVKLTVSSGTVLGATASFFTFNFQTSQSPPPAQTFQVYSSGPTVTYKVTAATNNCGANWLAVSPTTGTNSPETTISVSVDGTGLTPPQTCTGTITVSSADATNSVAIPVTFNVSSTALLNAAPSILTFTASTANPTPAIQTISLTTTDNTAVSFTAVASSGGGNWLFLGGSTGMTPNNLSVGVNVTALAVGPYFGTITITSPALPPGQTISISVAVTVVSNNNVTITPATLTFTQPQGGPPPAAQTLNIATSAGALPFTVASSSSPVKWLTVTPTSGNTPGTITVSVDGSTLSQATYTGQIVFTVPGAASAPAPVPVTLNVGPQQTMTASPAALLFAYQMGAGTHPPDQNITLTSTGGPAPFTVSATTTGGGQWLSASPTTGLTGGASNTAAVAVSVNPDGLAVGTYSGTLSITSSVLATPIQLTVGLTVSAMPPPAPTTITNAGSYTAGSIAPGEIITIKGTLLGPATPASFTLDAQKQVATTLADTQVLFDGIPGPVLYTSATQINAIVPYTIAGRLQTNVVVSYKGVPSSSIQMRVDNTAPGIFTASATGAGQGAILNQDYSVNSSSAPAAKGSVVQIFATGGGVTSPGGTTGALAPLNTLESLVATPVAVLIGGQQAQVMFAGSAPGLVEGVVQINAVVPSTVTSGNSVPVTVTIGSVTTTSSVTLAVK